MQPAEAVETLAYLERLRRRARRDLQLLWFPLVVFGVLTLGSVVPILTLGPKSLAYYWSGAGPLGGVLTAVYCWRRQGSVGLEAPAWPFALTGLGIMAGCFLLGSGGAVLGWELLSQAGPAAVVAAGVGVIAWLARSRPVLALAGGLGLLPVALALGLVRMEQATAFLALAYGAAFLVTGLVSRWVEGSR